MKRPTNDVKEYCYQCKLAFSLAEMKVENHDGTKYHPQCWLKKLRRIGGA